MEVISRYGTHVFGLSGCYIEHSGSTHEIAVNDPADGDVTTCGRDWGCPTVRRKTANSDQPLTRSALATTFFARNCEMIDVRCLRL
jgi:hypothetical protein